jgi:hypothetical protein
MYLKSATSGEKHLEIDVFEESVVDSGKVVVVDWLILPTDLEVIFNS